jgi:hypothetical protein
MRLQLPQLGPLQQHQQVQLVLQPAAAVLLLLLLRLLQASQAAAGTVSLQQS